MYKKIFLDLGTHNCQGLSYFINNELKIDNTWEVHTFEPNPFINVNECVKNFKNINITTHREAIWVRNDFINFNQYGNDGTSQGSLLEESEGGKTYGDFYGKTKVRCIDFYEFIQSLDSESEIYIKMDIEWSEYSVLQNMIDRGWPKNIKIIWVEWHNRDNDEYIKIIKNLTEIIESHKTKIINWY